MEDDKPLKPREQAFVHEYLKDFSAAGAARRAGYAPSSAQRASSDILARPHIADAVGAALAARNAKIQRSSEDLLRELWAIAEADASELTEVRIGSCRHCHGDGNLYQRTALEMARDRYNHKKSDAWLVDAEPFDEQGGAGYVWRRDANPHCTECFGEGSPRVVAKNVRTMSPAARKLFDGAKVTKDGLEIKARSRDAALALLAKHYFTEKIDATVTGNLGDRIIAARKRA